MKKTVNISDIIPLIKESLSRGKEVKFRPYGDSMLPTLVGGKDEVTLVSPTRIKPMDICLYERKDGVFVLHRLVKIKRDEYLMKGDNQLWIERGISRENIIAVVKNYNHAGKSIDCQKITYRMKHRLLNKTKIFKRIKRKLKKYL